MYFLALPARSATPESGVEAPCMVARIPKRSQPLFSGRISQKNACFPLFALFSWMIPGMGKIELRFFSMITRSWDLLEFLELWPEILDGARLDHIAAKFSASV